MTVSMMTAAAARAAEPAEVDAATVKAWLDRGAAVLVDVREKDEYARERISGAVLLPLSQLDGAQIDGAIAPAQQGKSLVVCCASGVRSAQAAQRLAARGIPAVAMKGGIAAWKRAGLPVATDTKAPLPIMRQVQIVSGSMALLGVVLGFAVHPGFFLLSGAVGAGLLLSGVTGTCMMANLLMKLPYNRAQRG